MEWQRIARDGKTDSLTLTLPFPPSTNRLYRHVGRRTLVSREGRRYRREVCAALAAVAVEPIRGRLEVEIDIYPPSRRLFDLDNRLKALLDAIEHAGIYENDNQIDRLAIERREVCPGGKVVVQIKEREWSRNTKHN